MIQAIIDRYKRWRCYRKNLAWIHKKFKEINEEKSFIEINKAIFKQRQKQDGIFARDGTSDFSLIVIYKLRSTGDERYTVGTSVDNLVKQSIALNKATLILIRFKKFIKRRGWYDQTTTAKSYSEILRKKQEVTATKQSGVSFYSGSLSIPD